MPGHVFVVQGRVESLVKDAVVVTTDAALTIEPHWEAVLGAKDTSGLRPERWGEDSAPFGAACGRPGLWFRVDRHDLDVVVATTDAQFAAIQRERRRNGAWDLDTDLLDHARALGEAAAAGRLALFLGAGVSIPAGLPSWSDLVDEMRALAVGRGSEIPPADFEALDVLDQTELLTACSASSSRAE